MPVDGLKALAPSIGRPVRVKRGTGKHPNAVDVGPGTKWNNPIKKRDVDALVSSEPDIAAAVKTGGWKAGAVILYRDHLLEAGLDPSELQGKDLSCTCELTEPCHADVLLELANA